MKTHWSRFGYMTACGKHLSGTQYLTRTIEDVTCKSCIKCVGLNAKS